MSRRCAGADAAAVLLLSLALFSPGAEVVDVVGAGAARGALAAEMACPPPSPSLRPRFGTGSMAMRPVPWWRWRETNTGGQVVGRLAGVGKRHPSRAQRHRAGHVPLAVQQVLALPRLRIRTMAVVAIRCEGIEGAKAMSRSKQETRKHQCHLPCGYSLLSFSLSACLCVRCPSYFCTLCPFLHPVDTANACLSHVLTYRVHLLRLPIRTGASGTASSALRLAARSPSTDGFRTARRRFPFPGSGPCACPSVSAAAAAFFAAFGGGRALKSEVTVRAGGGAA